MDFFLSSGGIQSFFPFQDVRQKRTGRSALWKSLHLTRKVDYSFGSLTVSGFEELPYDYEQEIE